MKVTKVIRILALFGILIIVGSNEFDFKSLFALILIPLFFIGTPWYKYLSKNTTK